MTRRRQGQPMRIGGVVVTLRRPTHAPPEDEHSHPPSAEDRRRARAEVMPTPLESAIASCAALAAMVERWMYDDTTLEMDRALARARDALRAAADELRAYRSERKKEEPS